MTKPATSSSHGPCTGAATTVTVTVVATNVVAPSPSTNVKYSKVTTPSSIGGGSSIFTTEGAHSSTVGPCMLSPPQGFVGMKVPSGGLCSLQSMTAISSSVSTTAASTPTSSISGGTISAPNVNTAFLAGFVALALFV